MRTPDQTQDPATAARARRIGREHERRTRRNTSVLITVAVIVAAFAAFRIFPALFTAAEDANGMDDAVSELLARAQADPLMHVAGLSTIAASERSVPSTSAVPLYSRPATITISAVGDMIFDRRVRSLVAAEGGLAPLEHVAELLARADITVGNLESPLSDGGTMNATKDVTFRGDPRAIAGLAASGFDFLSLANNHVLDYGPVALADTVAILDEAGIGHAGAGTDRTEAWEPEVRRFANTSIAFLSFSHILPPGFIATDSRAGLAAGRTDMSAVADAVQAAKAEHDYVIVSFHWGVEYVDFANADQVRDAHTTIDAGADMVLSHHPHVIQGVEYYGDGLIAYSLGDFVFDHYSRKTGEAFVLDATLGPDGITDVVCTPVYLDTNGAPSVVTGTEATVILERLVSISAIHDTQVIVDGDLARVVR